MGPFRKLLLLIKIYILSRSIRYLINHSKSQKIFFLVDLNRSSRNESIFLHRHLSYMF